MSTSQAITQQTRSPVTHVPLSDAVLPAVDMSIPPWPGGDRESGWPAS
jgi:hypothetical protein